MADDRRIELSVVVCTFNRADLLGATLSSLAVQTLAPSRFEVILVDNNSTDATAAVAAGFKDRIVNYRCMRETRQGLSHARNLGWQAARGDLVAFIDDDARAAEDWCERIVANFETVTPRPASVGGKILPFFEEGAHLPRWFDPEFEVRSWGERAGFLEGHSRLYGFSGSNMSFPKKVLARYGGFAADLGMQGRKTRLGEESFLFNHIQEQEPFFWYDPQLIVHHLVPRRNLQLRYRLTRSFASGRAVAYMRRGKSQQKSYRVEVMNTGYFAKELLYSLVVKRAGPSERVRKICDLVKQVGILFG